MNFQQELKKLNKAQRLAVETIEGPVMVVAGPGTGKTQVLTLRIANIRMKTDTPPESILALTFTDAAAGEMRERLVELMGQDGYKVAIRTFHSFCNELISEYPESFPHIAGGSSVADVDQIQLIRKLIDLEDLEHLRPFGDTYLYVRSIIKSISELKREGVSPDEFGKLLKAEEDAFKNISDLYNEKGKYKGKMKGKYVAQEKRIAKNKELLVLYRSYQKELLKNKCYDYDDMLIEAAAALKKDKSLLQTLHEKYLYVLVDEHQDTNNAQTAVLELLISYDDSPNLFMVGDPKQAIYRFQGASLENFEYFKTRFKKAKIINLEENYRSTQTIIDAATDIALGGGGLKAKSGHTESPISLYEFSSVDAEVFGIAKDIEGAIKAGTKPEEIAVLYRENKESEAVGGMLAKFGVSYAISADDDVLTDTQIQKLIRILLAIRRFGEPSYLCEALLVDVWGLDPLDVYIFTTYCRDNRLPHYQVIRSLAALKKVGLADPEKMHRVYQGIAGWKSLADNEGAARVFEFIVRESGYLAYLLKSSDSVGALAKLHSLFDMVKEFMLRKRAGTLHDFVDELELLREHGVRIKSKSIVAGLSSKVNLMTAHKAKGLQFERVYIIGAVDGRWGNRRSRDKIKLPPAVYSIAKRVAQEGEEDDLDERNLFYVALTRAKKHAIISYARHGADGKDQLASQFIAQIQTKLIEKANARKYEKQFLSERAISFAKPSEALAELGSIKTLAFIREQFEKSGITPTALNNYLECPLKYFYVNLVRIPEAPSKFSQFGNAVHAALRFAVEGNASGKSITKAQFLARFKTALRREPMTESEEEELIKKGEKSLGAYYDSYLMRSLRHGLEGAPIKRLSEYAIEGVTLSRDVMIRGRIDRVDINEDGSAHVVDYKTGKAKSRNQIAGLTKDADGNYYRQLVFYKLLLEKAGLYEVKDAELDFVEGPKREIFAPSDKEVSELEGQIKAMAKVVLAGVFAGCGEKDCRYCALAKVEKKR